MSSPVEIMRQIAVRYADWDWQRVQYRRAMLKTFSIAELKAVSADIGERIAVMRAGIARN